MRHLLSGAVELIAPARAHLAFVLVWLSAPVLIAQTPRAAPPNDLDAFMARVLARREVDRQALRQYILDDTERFEILGPGRAPLHRGRREFSWYEREGMHVRSPVRFDGVVVSEQDRRKYEEDWIRRERERLARRATRADDRKEAVDENASGASPNPSGTSVTPPRFVSEAYFMDFRFEPGNYYLAGREQMEGRAVLKIEYYPTGMFRDDKHEERGRRRREEPQDARDRDREQDINRKMNKTALITLWVDPAEHQIVKYTFDNVWMDFLPAAWLVRVEDIHASMTMGQPFRDVWLPREMNVHAGVSLASGPLEITYERQFANYKLGEVKSIIRTPGGQAEARVGGDHGVHADHEVQGVQELHGVRGIQEAQGVQRSPLLWGSSEGALQAGSEAAPHAPPAPHEPHAPDAPQSSDPEVIREIRVHGNAAVPDEEVVRLAGLKVGQALEPETLEAVVQRLKGSGAFESVEVRKRYRSLIDAGDVALVLLLHERPGAVSAAGARRAGRPWGRLGAQVMFLPILSYADGYGLSYGGRVSTVDALGGGEHLSVPLTWGGTRKAALEAGRTFKRGPVTRIESSVAFWQAENPRFGIHDRRLEVKGRAERRFARFFRTGLHGSRSSIDFGGLDDRMWTAGADAAIDTRADPTFPRNAFVIGGGWSGLHVRSQRSRIDRFNTDARGYIAVGGQAVAAGRIQYTAASSALPDYERLLLGGASTLRGFRAGTFDGDRTLLTSGEVRVPVTSVLNGARVGVTGFVDMGKAWNADSRAADAPWHAGVGGGLFLIAPLVKLNVHIARGLNGGATRLHLAAGFGF